MANKTADTAGFTPPPLIAGLMALAWVPLLTHLPWWTVTIGAVFVAWRYAQGRFLARPPRSLLWVLVVAVTLLVYGRFHTLVGEHPGLSLLVMLLGLKCLESETPREAVVLVLLCYVALLGDLLFQPSMGMGAFALAFLILSFVALSIIAQPRGLSFRQRLRQSAIVMLQAIPLAALAYVVFPRIAGGLWHSAPRPVGQTGLTPDLRPGSLSALLSSRAVAMRVIFHGPRPPRDRRYFRAYVLSVTNGRVWHPGPPGAPGVTKGRPYAPYTVLLNPTGNRVLPALDWPARSPQRGLLEPGGVVRARHAVRHLVRYRLASASERFGRLTPGQRRQELALPSDLNPRVRALAARLGQGAPSPRALAHRVLAYFVRRHFVYTLNPPVMGRHPMSRFLFQVRAGYCEDYAAAFATLMRAAGVPTRVVVGFYGGEFNPDGGDVIVRNYDAHAWDEIWARGRWLRVDPTAVVAPGALQERWPAFRRFWEHGGARLAGARPWWNALRHRARLFQDAATTDWDNWIVDYSGRRQAELLRDLGWRDAGPVALGLATIALAFVALSLVKTLGGRVRVPRDAARETYDRYCRRMGRIGVPRLSAEGPADYGARAARERPDLRDEIAMITRGYMDVRYGGRTATLPELKRRVKRFRPRRRPRRGPGDGGTLSARARRSPAPPRAARRAGFRACRRRDRGRTRTRGR